ncbi:hypothetical protein [Adlercreutzia sp. ZJ138]|uniref:hypothetical protein n=1 Tax=Adlercreutzia sp. ZJ138 TaxID=2709405 RepID=UPI0013EDD1E1|nr:hypothetical protein [Adlercreutzia sp. ZJ138]
MDSKYTYKGIDITLDVYEKLTDVLELISKEDSITFDEAFRVFAGSLTYEALADPRTLMWSESAPFILDEFQRERAENQRA